MSERKSYWYKPQNPELIGGLKSIKHWETKEICVNSQYGEVWPDTNSYKAIVLTSNYAQKMMKLGCTLLSGFLPQHNSGGEFLFDIPKAKINEAVKLLKIKKNRNGMIKRAENFNQKQPKEKKEAVVEDVICDKAS